MRFLVLHCFATTTLSPLYNSLEDALHVGLCGNIFPALPRLDVSQSGIEGGSWRFTCVSSLLPPCAFSEREREKREHTRVLHIAAEKDPRLLFPPGTESHFTLCLRIILLFM